MNDLKAEHRTAEYMALDHLRNQYTSHRTSIDDYEKPNVDGYTMIVYELVEQIGRYVLKFDGVDSYRTYINRREADWQKDS